MLNKISLAVLAASGALLSGIAIPAHAESASQVSKYDFNAIYNGQELHNKVNDLTSGAMHQNDFLNNYTNTQQSASQSSISHKDANGSAALTKSSLSLPAIPGTSYGIVDVGGSKSSFNFAENVSLQQSQQAASSQTIQNSSGQSKDFQNLRQLDQNASSNSFGSGNFTAGQTSNYNPHSSWFGGF